MNSLTIFSSRSFPSCLHHIPLFWINPRQGDPTLTSLRPSGRKWPKWPFPAQHQPWPMSNTHTRWLTSHTQSAIRAWPPLVTGTQRLTRPSTTNDSPGTISQCKIFKHSVREPSVRQFYHCLRDFKLADYKVMKYIQSVSLKCISLSLFRCRGTIPPSSICQIPAKFHCSSPFPRPLWCLAWRGLWVLPCWSLWQTDSPHVDPRDVCGCPLHLPWNSPGCS